MNKNLKMILVALVTICIVGTLAFSDINGSYAVDSSYIEKYLCPMSENIIHYDTNGGNKNTKHVYKINFATAVNICRAYLKHGGDETETMLLIQKYLTPVKYNRKYPIHLRPKRNRDFMYRVA